LPPRQPYSGQRGGFAFKGRLLLLRGNPFAHQRGLEAALQFLIYALGKFLADAPPSWTSA
jgi:hypothetical protein